MELYRRALIDDYLSSLLRQNPGPSDDEDLSPEALKASLKRKGGSYNDSKKKEADAKKAKKEHVPQTGGNPDEHKYAANKIAHKHFHP